jgi:hypothetical protein
MDTFWGCARLQSSFLLVLQCRPLCTAGWSAVHMRWRLAPYRRECVSRWTMAIIFSLFSDTSPLTVLDNCFGRFAVNNLEICRETQVFLDAVSPCRREMSRFCVCCLTVNNVDVLSNTSRTDILTFVGGEVIWHSYEHFTVSYLEVFFRASVSKIVDIISGLVGLPSPQFIWRLTLNNPCISYDVSRWIFSTSLLTNWGEFTRYFFRAFLLPFSRPLSVNLLDILSWRLSANLLDICF